MRQATTGRDCEPAADMHIATSDAYIGARVCGRLVSDGHELECEAFPWLVAASPPPSDGMRRSSCLGAELNKRSSYARERSYASVPCAAETCDFVGVLWGADGRMLA